MLEQQLNLSIKAYFVAYVIGVIAVLSFCRGEILKMSEYEVLYAGARLVGTPYLYDKTENRNEQIRAAGIYGGDELIYSRPPYVAAFMAPLAKLDYHTSLAAYEVLSALSLAGFIWLWRESNPWLTTLACAWSLPMALTFGFVRDGCFLLLLLAAAFRLYRRHPWTTGFVLSLLGIKFHLFLLLPLLFLGQRRWRMAAGFATGCAALLGISFAVAGLDWPVRMAAIIRTSTIEKQYLLPNLRGILQPFTDRFWPELILDVAVAAIVYRLIRLSGFRYGMCAVIAGGMLVSHHAGIYDCVVLIPVLLMVGRDGTEKIALWCMILLSPAAYALLSFGGIAAMAAKLAIASVLGLVYLAIARQRSSAPPLVHDLQHS